MPPPPPTQSRVVLDTMVTWSDTWLMKFNASKCHLLRVTRKAKDKHLHNYSINGTVLEQVDHHPYLGVELTSNLTWKHHINNITGKATRTLNLIRHHLYNCNREVKERAFNTLVRPHLEYASTVWDPYLKQDIDSIEKIQRKGARFVQGKYSYRDSVSSMLTELNWPPLHTRRRNKRLSVFYRAVNNQTPVIIPDYLLPSTGRTRTHDLAFIQIRINCAQFWHKTV